MKLNGFFNMMKLGDLEVPRPEADFNLRSPEPKIRRVVISAVLVRSADGGLLSYSVDYDQD